MTRKSTLKDKTIENIRNIVTVKSRLYFNKFPADENMNLRKFPFLYLAYLAIIYDILTLVKKSCRHCKFHVNRYLKRHFEHAYILKLLMEN